MTTSRTDPDTGLEWRSRRLDSFLLKADLPQSSEEIAAFRAKKDATGLPLRGAATAVIGAALGVSPRTISFVPSAGTFHWLFRAPLPNQASVIVRVKAFEPDLPAFELLTGKRVSDLVRAQGVATPRVLTTDLSRTLLPFDYEIIEDAGGTPLNRVENPVTQALEGGLLEALGEQISLVHGVLGDGFGTVDFCDALSLQGLFPSWKDVILTRLEEHRRVCLALGAIDPGDDDRIDWLFREVDTLLDAAPSRLLHGDLANHNCLVRDGMLAAIVDWEDCLLGDPVYDLAYWGTSVRDVQLEPLIAGYRVNGVLPADFEERYWLYYLRVGLAKTVHRARFGYADRPGRPLASSRIQKALHQLLGRLSS